MQRLRRNTGPAGLIIACLALVVAVSGGAYAAVKLGKNAVKAKNIKNGAVNKAKLRTEAVVQGKIADAAVSNPKLAPNAVTASTITAPTTQFTLSGPTADADAVANGGAVGKTGIITASCPSPQRLISGGARWNVGNDGLKNVYINQSFPDGQNWKAEGIVDSGNAAGTATLEVLAICQP